MENLKNRMNAILNGFNVGAECVKVQQHRHLVFFDLKLNPGTKVRSVENISKEMYLLLNAKTAPIITLVPSEGVLRVRVALDDAPILDFNTLYNNNIAPNGVLPFIIGETGTGKPLWLDMAKNPHMLVAGSTGSGKSTLLHVLIENAKRRDDVDLYLVDPKHGVEFGVYEDDVVGIALTYNETVAMLQQIHDMMEQRFDIMKTIGVKSIEDCPDIFNKALVIIDEVADIMQQDSNKKNPNKDKFKDLLVSLAQKARATGIYLVAATQRPSTNVLDGVIKASFPARIACRVDSSINSRVILDDVGAENLLGRGDAILNCSQHSKVGFQVAYVDS